jgi:hypothetical protein
MLEARQLGLNCLRLHIKPADPRYLDLADEMGLLMWEEVPSWRTLYPKERLERQGDLPVSVRQRVRSTLFGLIERDRHHPSVVIYSIVNEDWGTQLVLSAADRAWLADLYAEAKALDPSRLVCDNSPCHGGRGPNVHVRTDIDDFHIYYGMPDGAAAFAAFVESFGQRPAWTFSPFGDAQRSGHEPLILSEFGNWGLPTATALRRCWRDEAPPWWLTSHAWWHAGGNEASQPAGLAERLTRWRLTAIWPDADAFAQATQWHQFAALQYQLWTIRRRSSLRGFVITEFTDCYWEANGLLDFDRQPKVFHHRMAEIAGPTVLVPELDRWAVWSDTPLPLTVGAAHDGPTLLRGLHLTASLDGQPVDQITPLMAPPVAGQRSLTEVTLPVGDYRPVATVTLPATTIEQARLSQFELTLTDASGVCRARAALPLLIVPAAARPARRPGRLLLALGGGAVPSAGPATVAAEQFGRLGYSVTDDLDTAELVVASVIDDGLLAWLRAGGRLLYLPAADTVSPFLPILHRPSPWDGNWISAYHFIRPGAWLTRLPIANPLGFPFASVLPQAVITGYADEEQADLLAGLLVGWGQRLVATIGQHRAGAGRVLTTTFRLLESFGHAPVATIMLHDLIEYVLSPDWSPTKRLP